MKKVLLLIAICLVGFTGLSQEPTFDNLTYLVDSESGIVYTTVNTSAIDLAINYSPETDASLAYDSKEGVYYSIAKKAEQRIASPTQLNGALYSSAIYAGCIFRVGDNIYTYRWGAGETATVTRDYGYGSNTYTTSKEAAIATCKMVGGGLAIE